MTTASTEKDRAKRKPWSFMERWRIEGCLFTESPLHIGNGTVIPHPSILVDDKPAEVNAMLKDHAGRPTLPGASIKGCLRAWVESCVGDTQPELIRAVFGKQIFSAATESDKINKSVLVEGGRATFNDAPLVTLRAGETPLPFWDNCANTYIEANNSIDRHTHTAADKHLLYTECVPAGVGFSVAITGNFSERDAAFILYILSGFNDEQNPILIGADTRSGKGRCRWEQGRVYRMDKEATVRWMKNENRILAENELPELSSKTLASLRKRFAFVKRPNRIEDVITIDITLEFKSHFLVNDPPLKTRGGEEKDSSDPDMRPLVDEMNKVILPAKSFRGAFRSQAEKILRTLSVPCCEIGNPCRGITKIADAKSLCPACKIFGATGWGSLLSVSDFKLVTDDYEFTTQEFIAVDRFTGGGRDGAKFNTKAIYKPRLKGTIEIDWQRLMKIEPSEKTSYNWAVALIALTLRDLKEGDITFGYGAAKGYGECTWVTEGTHWNNPDFQNYVRASMPAWLAFIEESKADEKKAVQDATTDKEVAP